MARKPDNISQEAWDAVNSPALTDDELAKLRPARDVLRPKLFEKLTKRRGTQKAPTKEAVSLCLDRDVVDHFRATGSGWQTKINEALRKSVAGGTVHVGPGMRTADKSAEIITTRSSGTKSERIAVKGDALPPRDTRSGRLVSDKKASRAHSDKKRG